MALASASEGESPGQEAILVLGCAGAGKSSFIATATGLGVRIGHGPEVCTKTCSPWAFNDGHGLPVTLIDTPGLGYSGLEEIEVVRCVTQYLESNAAFRIIGVVYLHPIVERRLSSTARQILQLLKDICGQEYYPNIVFATSLWDTAPDSMHQELEQREKLLRQDKEIWGEMILKGACCERLSGTPESSKRIIGVCLRMARPPPLRIMSELRTGTSLEATTVLRREQYPSPKPWLVTGLGKTSSDIEILAILRYEFPIADDDYGAKDIIRVDSKRIEHVFAEQFCQDFVPNPQQTAYATLMAEVRLRETFARRSSMHGDAEGAGREAAIKEEVKRLRALLEGDPIST